MVDDISFNSSCFLHIACENLESDESCDMWTLQNQCTLNPPFMTERCRKSCTGCSSTYTVGASVNNGGKCIDDVECQSQIN